MSKIELKKKHQASEKDPQLNRFSSIESGRSRSTVNMAINDDDDVWFDLESFYLDNLNEILQKWKQIDPEIWGKIICMERNRRIAKAYLRAHVISINGSDKTFDGLNLCLSRFINEQTDLRSKEIYGLLKDGINLSMDDIGNLIITTRTSCNVFLRGWCLRRSEGTNSVGFHPETLKISGEDPFVLFDMDKFMDRISLEMRTDYPDRKKLERECISMIGFGRNCLDLLDQPSWLIVINIVAMEILKSKFPRKFKTHKTSIERAPVNDERFAEAPSDRTNFKYYSNEGSRNTSLNQLDLMFKNWDSNSSKSIHSTLDSKLLVVGTETRHQRLVRLPTPDYFDDSASKAGLPKIRLLPPTPVSANSFFPNCPPDQWSVSNNEKLKSKSFNDLENLSNPLNNTKKDDLHHSSNSFLDLKNVYESNEKRKKP